MTTYICSNCKIKVIIISEKIITPCSCNASIIAEIQANPTGAGKVSS